MGQGLVFTVGILPLLYTLREAGRLTDTRAVGLYVASSAAFLAAVWVALKVVPGKIDQAYYAHVGNASASEPDSPDWDRFAAPLCIFTPLGLAGVGVLDAWQATVVGLTGFGLLMYLTGKFALKEPATEIIGAIVVLCGGAVASEPHLAVTPQGAPGAEWLMHLLGAQCAALGMAGWLGIGWLIAAIMVHLYNRLLLRQIRHSTGGREDQ